MLGRAMMTARRHVVAHHPADRLRPFPVDIAFMSARHQRQPLAARHAALLHPHARTVIARCDTGLTIRINAAVDQTSAWPRTWLALAFGRERAGWQWRPGPPTPKRSRAARHRGPRER